MKRMSRSRSGARGVRPDFWRVFRVLRLLLLLGILATAFVLNRWSHAGDPRFFTFLASPAGQAVARTFGWWRSSLERPVPAKSFAQMTPREQATQREIAGAMLQSIQWDLPHITELPYRVGYRDVAFRMDFEDMPLYVDAPYLLLSDVDPDMVHRTLLELHRLHGELRRVFGPVLNEGPSADPIHVVMFDDPDAYRGYQKEQARSMKNTAGFYSPTANRLVLFLQPGVSLDQTLAIARHEAAHQLFFTYGVHSRHRIENEWLIEGLACYCESATLGEADPELVAPLAHGSALNQDIPIRELVNHRCHGGLLGYKTTEMAYGESWSLVHHLMQPENRNQFFAYLRYVRDPANFDAVRKAERFALLAEFYNVDTRELATRWQAHVDTLVAR